MKDLIEFVSWMLVLSMIGAVIFLAVLFFPRFQYKFCVKEYIKSHQDSGNYLQANANEKCEDWIK